MIDSGEYGGAFAGQICLEAEDSYKRFGVFRLG